MMHRLARFSVRRRRLVLLAWLAVATIAAPGATRVETVLSGAFGSSVDGQAAAVRALRAEFPAQSPDSAAVVLTTPARSAAVGDPAFEAALDDVVARLRTVDSVGRILTYRDAGVPRAEMVAPDGHTALVTVGLDSESMTAAEELTPVLRRALGGVEGPPGLDVMVTGPPAVWYDMVVAGKQGTARAELLALPLTAVALAFAFGTVGAAVLPLLVGVLSVSLTLALLYLLGSVFGVYLNTFTQSVTTILGLAVGIDYALLMVSRFREELRAGRGADDAAVRTATTAGRAILFSGGTVALSLAALILPNSLVMRSVGYAGVIVVFVAITAALTAVPAALALLGTRIDAWRILPARTRARTARPPAASFWRRWAHAVMRRPALSVALVLVALVALASPAPAMIPNPSGIEILPAGSESRRGAQALLAMGKLGAVNPLDVVLDTGAEGGVFRPATVDALHDLEARLRTLPVVATVVGPTTGPSLLGAAPYRALYRSETAARSGPLGTLADLTVSRGGRYALLTLVPTGQLTKEATRGLERDVLASVSGDARLAGASVLFGGMAQASLEQFDTLWHAFPRTVAIILAATFVLLLLAFRSLLIPLKAIVLNALSVLASYGVLVAVFQFGWGSRLLGIGQLPDPAQLCYLVPVLLFALIFGLSMDYEVFLVSRIQEAHQAGHDTRDSVAYGIERSGPIVTWAAVIMLTVFLAFLSAPILDIKETGLPLAVAVLLDATLVRMVLVPATMQLASRWNWWLPAFLERVLPRVKIESSP